MVASQLHWQAGWALILAGFASGAALGLAFHRDDFWGGYASWRRRLARLGHIACVALGMLQLLYALGPAPSAWCGGLWLFGSVAMPATCFLAAWKPALRHLFVLPVTSLVAAAALTLAATFG